MSPIFRRENGYIFKIYSNEEERKHIHVIKAENEAKFWLEPVIELVENYGFNNKEIKNITQIIEKYGDEFKCKFTDLQGWLNQYIASKADEVVLMISGIPVKIKG